jgi:hypothetical protein
MKIPDGKGAAFMQLKKDKNVIYEEIVDYVLKYRLEPPIAAKEKDKSKLVRR